MTFSGNVGRDLLSGVQSDQDAPPVARIGFPGLLDDGLQNDPLGEGDVFAQGIFALFGLLVGEVVEVHTGQFLLVHVFLVGGVLGGRIGQLIGISVAN